MYFFVLSFFVENLYPLCCLLIKLVNVHLVYWLLPNYFLKTLTTPVVGRFLTRVQWYSNDSLEFNSRLFAFKCNNIALNITQSLGWRRLKSWFSAGPVKLAMNAKSQEEKPLRTDSFRIQDPECRTNAAAQGRFLSRGVIATVIALIIVLIILVIVLGSLLGKERCSLQQEHKGK